MSHEQVMKVHQAAIALYGDGSTASSIAAMEQAYLEFLAADGAADTETARETFGVDRAAFWFDAF